jgi:tetratricopeptide (TPR) repeat protein
VLLAALVAGLALAVYRSVGGHAFVNYDDPLLVTQNAQVRAGLTRAGVGWAFTTLATGNWYPLTWLSHMLDVQLFGLDPGGHHLTSLALHAADTALAFLALRALTGAPWPSAFAAALFAAHPLHAEAVAWVSGRKELLCGLFWLAALLAWGRYARRPGPGRYLAVAGLFALSLAAKPAAVVVPLLLLVLDFWPLNRFSRGGPGLARLLLEKAPLLALSTLVGAVTVYAQRREGALAGLGEFPPAARGANALLAGVTYLRRTLAPTDLAAFYPHRGGAPLWQVAAAAALLAGGTWLCWRARRRRPALLAGWAFFFVGILPVLGLLQAAGQGMADRYTYVPILGLFLIPAWGLRPGGRAPAALRALAKGGALTAVAALSLAGARQAGYWRSGRELFTHALEVTEGNHVAEVNLGTALVREGLPEEALPHFLRALELRPGLAEAHNGVGNVLLRRGDPGGALPHYRAAQAANPAAPEFSYNLGLALLELGRPREAVAHLQRAARALPGSHEAQRALDAALRRSAP